MPSQHAILSASSAHRWLNCTPSVMLCETFEDKPSEYAAEGTEAHELCEYKLKTALGMEADDPTPKLSRFNDEMEECANGYASYVLEQVNEASRTCSDPKVLIEQRVDFSRWVPEGFGTADCVIIADGTLRVVDYKHGLGVLVEAEMNPQMMCYALGALELFDALYDISKVSMTIYQPRRENISTFEISRDELLTWADKVLKPAAKLAFEGKGEFYCGEWCGFCKAKHRCRARAEENLLILGGKSWNGWKLVEGRANRRYTDENEVIKAVCEAGFDPFEKKVLGITAMQKLLGKTKFEKQLSAYIEKPQGKPTLVPESDKRPEISCANLDFKEE